MANSANDFYTSVKALLNNNSNEIDLRNAASRVYYSIYHDVINQLNINPVSDGKNGVHKSVSNGLLKAPSRKVVQIGYKLDFAKKIRSNADYDLCRDFSYSDVLTLIELRDAISNLLQEHIKQSA